MGQQLDLVVRRTVLVGDGVKFHTNFEAGVAILARALLKISDVAILAQEPEPRMATLVEIPSTKLLAGRFA